ncbi:hypothetical protein PHMEG_0004783 [Phytophthora megakarya]|uniref:Uncharacterized protein n=1 Tax=Phytophthora megakarya TaxID=4795 RepID=A0A225WUM6_9STRA|nr:hypothetical protein PHMEG_0004783 [Phytophthora megakarya]
MRLKMRSWVLMIYKSIAFYDTLAEGEQALHSFNRFIYTYRTQYVPPFVLGKVYHCYPHIGCRHRMKLAIHREDETSFRYQLLQRGHHCGASVCLPERGISPVLNPEIDAL